MDLRERIKSFPGSLRELAREADVNHVTIMMIRDGITENPGVRTVGKIEGALDRLAQAAADAEAQRAVSP